MICSLRQCRWFLLALLMGVGLAVALAGCSTNPATGEKQLSLVSDSQLRDLSQQEAAAIVEQAGGLYKEHPGLNDYIKTRMTEVVKVSELAHERFNTRLLDTYMVNASALPGYINVYRGILPLFNNEAEMMAVMGHEVGHVTARHSAQRMTGGILAGAALQIGAALIGEQTQSQQAVDLFATLGVEGAKIGLASYSRGQEMQADDLGIRYLSRLCYDPYAASEVQRMFVRYEALNEVISRAAGFPVQNSFYAKLMRSHPESPERVAAAREEAAKANSCGAMQHQGRYLKHIDGMAFGPKRREGFGAGKRFYHPTQRFVMQVPEHWVFPNIYGLPVAVNSRAQGFLTIKTESVAVHMDAEEALIQMFPQVGTPQRVDVDGFDVYTARIQPESPSPAVAGKVLRVFAFRGEGEEGSKDGQLIVLSFWANAQVMDVAEREFFDIAKSLKRLTKTQADKIRKLEVRVHTVKAGETVAGLAARMPFGPFAMQWFQTLNNLETGQALAAGDKVKLIVDPNAGMAF